MKDKGVKDYLDDIEVRKVKEGNRDSNHLQRSNNEGLGGSIFIGARDRPISMIRETLIGDTRTYASSIVCSSTHSTWSSTSIQSPSRAEISRSWYYLTSSATLIVVCCPTLAAGAKHSLAQGHLIRSEL